MQSRAQYLGLHHTAENFVQRSASRVIAIAAVIVLGCALALAVAAPAHAMQTTEGDSDVVIELIPATSSSIAAPDDGSDAAEVDTGVESVQVEVTPTVAAETAQAPARYSANNPQQRPSPGAVDVPIAEQGPQAGAPNASVGDAAGVDTADGNSGTLIAVTGALGLAVVVMGWVWMRLRQRRRMTL